MKLTRRKLKILIESALKEAGTGGLKGAPSIVSSRKPPKKKTKRIPPGFLDDPENRRRFALGNIPEEEIFSGSVYDDYYGRYAGSDIDKSNPMSHLMFGEDPEVTDELPYQLEDIPDDPIERKAREAALNLNIGGGERSAQDPDPTMLDLPDEAPAYMPRALEAEERQRYISAFLKDFMEEKGYTDEDTIPMGEFGEYVRERGYYFPMKTLQKEVRRIKMRLLIEKLL